jgi:DNA-binding Lrp family transcriptional regulator
VSYEDDRLLTLLTTNAREPVASLARKLGLARSTVQERITRLERDGVIAGYTVRLPRPNIDFAIRATVLIKLDAKQTENVLRDLHGLPNVRRVTSVSGPYDYIAELVHESTATLDQLLDRIGRLPGVQRTETLINLATRFER